MGRDIWGKWVVRETPRRPSLLVSAPSAAGLSACFSRKKSSVCFLMNASYLGVVGCGFEKSNWCELGSGLTWQLGVHSAQLWMGTRVKPRPSETLELCLCCAKRAEHTAAIAENRSTRAQPQLMHPALTLEQRAASHSLGSRCAISSRNCQRWDACARSASEAPFTSPSPAILAAAVNCSRMKSIADEVSNGPTQIAHRVK